MADSTSGEISTPVATTTHAPATITIRAPATIPSSWTPPPLSLLLGTWHVTHSTLSMWRKNRNVRITYSAILPSSTATTTATPPRLLDTVTYTPVNSTKLKTITGVDTPSGDSTHVWDWRGKGWLFIASSHWEVIGYGGESEGEEGEQWAVTYFAKTLFTPAGMDIYSRRKEGLSKGTVEAILEALKGVEHEGLKGMVAEVFVVGSDHYKS